MRRTIVLCSFVLLFTLPTATAQSICPDDTGSALRQCVRGAYSPSPIGYGPARDVLYGSIDAEGNQLSGIYSGFTITLTAGDDPSSDAFDKGINAEHVVPQSAGMGSEPARGDMHNLRPTRVEVNSARGSLPFDESPDAETDDWYVQDQEQSSIPTTNIDAYSERDVNTRFEPRESVKGDIARAVFYTATLWESRMNRSFISSQLPTLLQWHAEDPVTSAEIDRSAAIADEQGNENPFVLDETLAERAFGDGYTQAPVDVQTIAEARARGTGATVTVSGTVTRAFGAYARIQDESGPTGASGLVIRQTEGPNATAFQNAIANGTLVPGTALEVTGTLSAFRNLLQINGDDLQSFTIGSTGSVPPPQAVTLGTLQANGEDYESELVKVVNLSFPSATGTFENATSYDVTDGPTTLTFRVQQSDESNLDGEPIPTGTFTYEGVVGQYESNYQLIPIRPGTALPVELTAFDVTTAGTTATLVWQTASETNNAGFQVQRAVQTSGGDVSTWESLGFVEGNGTTTQPHTYRFRVDALTPGQHTFRLKQVDTDGTTSLSSERTITVRTDAVLSVQGPNPMRSGQQARLTVQVDAAQSVDVALYNVLGQRVQTIFTGSATPTTPAEAMLTTDRLPSGVYFLRATGASIQATEQLTIVR